MKHIAIVATLALVALANTADADTIRVDWNGGGDYTTINAAVTAASEGDSIVVADGTYSGTQNTEIMPYQKNVVIESENGAAVTIIDGTDQYTAFNILDGQDSTMVVSGFTLANCHGSSNGGAFEVSGHSSPIIEDCVFEGCTSPNGGAMALYQSSSVVRDCVFRANSATYRGGAIYTYECAVTFSRCLFDENVSSAAYRSGAIYTNASADLLTGCTLVENQYDAVQVYAAPGFEMRNCIIAGTVDGLAVYDPDTDGSEISHCVVFGNALGDSLPDHNHDNLFVDPLFCNAPGNGYEHCADSQCLPTVNGWGELVGAYDEGCPSCGSPVEHGSWGVIKALFR